MCDARWILESICLRHGSMKANRYPALVQALRGTQGDAEVLMLDASVYGFLSAGDDHDVGPIQWLVT